MLKIANHPKPLVLCILDGWGIAGDSPDNAITQARCQTFNRLWFSYPHTLLLTSGQSVGLPQGQVGNSEVGHTNLGAGRIVFQDPQRIDLAIEDGSFFQNEALESAVNHVRNNNSNIHVMGLVGLGSVHSNVKHLFAVLSFLKKEQVGKQRVKIHLFTDGRDSPPTSAKNLLSQIDKTIKAQNLGEIASICGRFYAMDRDNRWDRTREAYFALLGQSQNTTKDVLAAIENSYLRRITDEFIPPSIITDNQDNPVGPIREKDSVIFFNYRQDRARQLTKAFVLEKLENIKTSSDEDAVPFKRGPKLKDLFFVSFTQYEQKLPVSAVAFKPEPVVMPIARVFSERNSPQLHIAETEKYAHVTYFFNGGREAPFRAEDRILVNSPKVATYDLAPQMGTPEITKRLVHRINTHVYEFIVVNLANADMVAHTGNIEATIEGVKTVDFHLGIIVKATLAAGGGIVITADHGNAEEMVNSTTAEIDTEHNNNPAPCIFVLSDLMGTNIQLPQGILADVAPTILSILKIPKPSQMTGRNLLE